MRAARVFSDESGQMVVEMAVVAPVMIVVAIIAVNHVHGLTAWPLTLWWRLQYRRREGRAALKSMP